MEYIGRFNEFLDETHDARLDNYPFMGTLYKAVALVIAYLTFVKIIGPKLMENRKPFELNRIMFIYNLFQVVINFLFAIVSIYYFVTDDFIRINCPLVDFSDTPRGLLAPRLTYVYFLFKVLDLTDTIFMTLRKRYKQASGLHIYHHTTMVIGTQIILQYYPGGVSIIPGILNCIVHTVMYFYFLITAVHPELKGSIWWKKHITQLQILQFFLNFCHILIITLNGDCEYSKRWASVGLLQNFIFLILFINFYVQNYILKKVKVK